MIQNTLSTTIGMHPRLSTFSLIVVLAIQLLAGSGCTTSNTGSDDGSNDDGNTDVDTTAKMVFGVIGDYGDDDDNSKEVADLIKSWNPNFIATVGDNDYSDGAFRGTFDALELSVGQYFQEFIGNYQGLLGPGATENRFFPTPGDHDWGDTCDDPAGLDDYLRYFTLPSDNTNNERYYDYRQGPIHLFSIHSIKDCEPDGTAADSVQGDWVREAAAASDATFKIAYFHNPPYSSGANHIGDGAHMQWPWADWGFDLVLSGDDHIYERIEREGVIYIVNGLGGVDIHGFVDTPVEGSVVRYADNYGAVRVDAFDDRLEVSFINVDGAVIDTFTINSPDSPNDNTTTTTLDPNVAPITEGNWLRLDIEKTWQWQLQPNASSDINTAYSVDVYDIDLFDAPEATITALQAQGRSVICYFSAGTFEDFRDDASEFLAEELGNALSQFADERWLDIRSSNIQRIMLARLDVAVSRGCDGVEPDNMDGYQNNSGFDLTASDQLAFNRFIANAAHERGLSVGLKNDLDQISELVDYYDFAVNEQCHEFDECETLQPFINANKAVFNAEYADSFVNDTATRDSLCASALNDSLRTLVLPLDLDDSFRFSCEP